MSKESKRNFVNACKKHFESKMAPMTQQELLRQKVETVTIGINHLIQPIVKAGGYLTSDGKESLRETVFTLYFQAFDSNKAFSREELAAVLSQLHLEIMIQSLDADPAGTGTPDLIS